MALKDVIRRNRKRLGVSVDEFARLMGIGRATAFRWEAGYYWESYASCRVFRRN